MPKIIQIRGIDDEVYGGLVRRSAEAGITVPEQLRRQAVRIASRPSVGQWLERTRRRPSDVSPDGILDILDEERGPRPDPRR